MLPLVKHEIQPRQVRPYLRWNMMEADESCMPNIVEDNYAAQVIRASFEYY